MKLWGRLAFVKISSFCTSLETNGQIVGERDRVNWWISSRHFFPARLHFPSSPLSAPGSPRMLSVFSYAAFSKGAFLWDDPDQYQWSEITRIMVDQMNWWILSGQGFIGLFDLPWSKWFRITDPDLDHINGTHPKISYRAGTEGTFHWDDPSQDY